MKRRSASGFTLLEVLISLAILMILVVIVYMVVLASTQHAATQATALQMEDECQKIMDQITRDLRLAMQPPVGSWIVRFGPSEIVAGTWRVWQGVEFQVIRDQRPDDPAAGGGGLNPFTGVTVAGGSIRWQMVAVDELTTDGIDNDNDGLIDEVAIRRTHDWVDSAGTPRIDVTTYSLRGTTLSPITAPTGGTVTQPPSWGSGATAPGLALFVIPAGLDYDDRVGVRLTLQGQDARGRRMTKTMMTLITRRNN